MEDVEESKENSTENTRKRILPNRTTRGLRMKVLEGKELEAENDLYNTYFCEKSSDDDFNVEEESGGEDSFDSDFAKEDNAEEGEEQDEEEQDEQDDSEILRKIKSGKRRKAEENNIDIDNLDIEKIDQIELQRDMGIEIVQEACEEVIEKPKKKGKKPKRRGKAFIDDEDSYLQRKRIFPKPISKKHKKQKVEIDNITININKDNVLEEEKIKKDKAKAKDSQTVKFSYLQDKPSQKDLLFEAIFTEIYNKKSLEEMQRLEDLNKRELISSSKRQFNEYIRSFKTEKDIDAIEEKNKLNPDKKSNISIT
jgi:hypothetical protein